jgi:AraC-like DNA-binding protein
MIIRESCGCQAGKPTDNRRGVPLSAADLARDLSELFHLDETDRNAVIEPLVGALAIPDAGLFLRLLDRTLLRFFDEDRDLSLLYTAIALAKDCPAIPHASLGDLETSVYMLIARVQNRVQALKQFVTSKRYSVLNSLKCDLLCARDRESLVAILYRHLPQIGMHSGAIVLYENASHSRYIGGFSGEGIQPDSDLLFPARLLLPSLLLPSLSSGVTMVLPLFMENQPLGYFITTVPFYEGTIYEDLRSAISSALKGVFLFEESATARETAERAERTKTEFFANVGGDLCDPLNEILERLRRAEDSLVSATLVPAALRDDVQWLQSQIRAQLEKTNSLIDLTLAQSNELSLEKKLFNITELVPEAGRLPLICGDPARFAQAFGLVRKICPGPISVEALPEGLTLRFSADGDVDPSLWHAPDALLAEKIVLMQYGRFTPQPRGCEVLIPWPNLAGLPPGKASGVPLKIRCLSPDLDPGGFGLPVERGIDPVDPSADCDGLILAWNCDTARMDEWVAVYALRQHAGLFRAPFLCFGGGLSGESLIAGIEARVRERSQGPILFVGLSWNDFPGWADQSNSVSVPDFETLNGTLREVQPSLIVFDRVCSGEIAQIRKHPRVVRIPALVLPERLEKGPELEALCQLPRIIVCNRSVASSPEFSRRVKGLLAGDEILPPHTGALVKMAILFLNLHSSRQVARWKLADSVNVSEDYLTRIFHREMGISLWEYLNRYRIELATDMLLHTNLTIYEIALRTGFQDQAYFCRVFKKIHGVPPGKIRTKN